MSATHLNSHTRRGYSIFGFHSEVPIGISIIQKLARTCCPHVQFRRAVLYKSSIIFLTFMAYTLYHMSRKPISVVKSVLHFNCTLPNSTHNDCGYAPFDEPDAKALFGLLDSAFLFAYAIGMFVSGYIAERVSLRLYLGIGMIGSGFLACLFGAAKSWSIHSLWYFVVVQMVSGILQTTGWPGVVTLMARWFGEGKRGTIFGLWNSHTSVGNILGTLVAAYFVEKDWMLSFVVPGLIMIAMGFIVMLFVVDSPSQVGLTLPHQTSSPDVENREQTAVHYDAKIENYRCLNDNSDVSYRASERTPILERTSEESIASGARVPVSPMKALSIPGVMEFAMCLFFAKLISYTFLYWLPLYIMYSTTLSPTIAADLSTLFDVGGIAGGITAGMLSDYSGMPASICSVMLIIVGPALLLYQHYGTISMGINISLLLIAGFVVNGPYALITTAVCAELGQHPSLMGNAEALATVTAIIDGTGSIGAAVGPLLAGLVSKSGWENVFLMLIFSDICALLLLVRLVIKEILKKRRRLRRNRIE